MSRLFTSLRSFLPFLGWFPLSRASLRADLFAGLSVAVVLIPQALAYAQLAGLPPHFGLYAALVPTIVGALFGSCPQLSTGPVAMSSLLSYAVLTDLNLAPCPSEQFNNLAVILAGLAGLILLAVGVFKLTIVINFISHPAIMGFTNAGAIIIALSQLGKLVGIDQPRTGFYLHDVLSTLARLHHSHLPTLAFGLLSLTTLLILKQLCPRCPGVLIVVVVATLISSLCGFNTRWHGDIVGHIPPGFPPISLPKVSWELVVRLFPGAATVALIGFMETAAVCKSISAHTRQRLHLRQEVIAQGLAKLAGFFTSSYTTSGSLSRSALNWYCGAKTGLSSLIAAATVALTLLFLTPLLYHLPIAVLAAIIIVAVLQLLNLPAMHRIWQADPLDGVTAWVTFAACLLLAPKIAEGILVGIVLALGFHLYRIMRPNVAILAPHPDGTYRDGDRHRLPFLDDIIPLRFEGRLCFANAEHFELSLLDALSRFPRARAVIVVADGINAIDASGEEKLREIFFHLRETGILLTVAEAKWRVLDVLTRTGLYHLIGPDNFFRSVDQAVSALRARLAPPPSPT
ncbi:MAG: sulfate permease [bacterium]|nr:sulfate permease [bacterium]